MADDAARVTALAVMQVERRGPSCSDVAGRARRRDAGRRPDGASSARPAGCGGPGRPSGRRSSAFAPESAEPPPPRAATTKTPVRRVMNALTTVTSSGRTAPCPSRCRDRPLVLGSGLLVGARRWRRGSRRPRRLRLGVGRQGQRARRVAAGEEARSLRCADAVRARTLTSPRSSCPTSQLLVVSAAYSRPSDIEYRLYHKEFHGRVPRSRHVRRLVERPVLRRGRARATAWWRCPARIRAHDSVQHRAGQARSSTAISPIRTAKNRRRSRRRTTSRTSPRPTSGTRGCSAS